MLICNPTTEEDVTAEITAEELRAMLLNKQIIGLYERHGSLEVHVHDGVLTVKPEHFSFVEKVKP